MNTLDRMNAYLKNRGYKSYDLYMVMPYLKPFMDFFVAEIEYLNNKLEQKEHKCSCSKVPVQQDPVIEVVPPSASEVRPLSLDDLDDIFKEWKQSDESLEEEIF